MKIKGNTPEDIIIKLKKTIKKIEQIYVKIDEGEISRSQIRIIFPILRDSKGYSMQELSDLVGVDKALVSRTITNLNNKGIIERDKKTDSNERNYKIILTEKGKKLFEKRMEKTEDILAEWYDGISDEELTIFKNVLDRLSE